MTANSSVESIIPNILVGVITGCAYNEYARTTGAIHMYWVAVHYYAFDESNSQFAIHKTIRVVVDAVDYRVPQRGIALCAYY
jgi:hypothetical protein